MARPILDFSKGDPARALTGVARYAFRKASKNLNHYYLPNAAGDTRYPLLKEVSEYFKSRGFLNDSFFAANNLLVTGGGTTEAYELIIRLLAKDLKERAAQTGETFKPVIVMPVPTYGFFFNSAREWGFELAFIERDMQSPEPAKRGGVDAKKLDALLTELGSQGKRVVAYYDSNPNNPLGRIRGHDETSAIMQVLFEHTYRQKKDDDKADNRRLDEMIKRGATDRELLSVTAWWGSASRIRVIDDLVYDGLEYADVPKGVGFGQLEDTAWGTPADDTFTITGPSKAGLVNLRAGLIVSKFATELRNMQLSTSYSSTDVAFHAVHAFYNDTEPFAAQRKKHLDRMNAEHRFNGQFMKSLIDGFGTTPELAKKDKERMIRLLARVDKISRSEARTRLENGIEGIKVITDPQAGFFHLLDYSNLIGRTYEYTPQTAMGQPLEKQTLVFKDSEDIKKTFGIAGIGFAYADWMGLDPVTNPITRVTFAEPPEKIIALANRLSEVTKTLSPAPKAPVATENRIIISASPAMAGA